MIYWFLKIFIAPILFVLMRPRIRGYKNMWQKGPLIIVCNHQEAFDPAMIAIAFPRTVHFMAKNELFEKKINALLLGKGMYVFPVDREKAGVASVRKAVSLLEEGKVFGIFPEGSRSVTGDMDVLEKGAAFISVRSGAPVLPIYMSRDAYRKLRLDLTVGEPIDPKAIAERFPGKPVDVMHDAIRDALTDLMNRREAE